MEFSDDGGEPLHVRLGRNVMYPCVLWDTILVSNPFSKQLLKWTTKLTVLMALVCLYLLVRFDWDGLLSGRNRVAGAWEVRETDIIAFTASYESFSSFQWQNIKNHTLHVQEATRPVIPLFSSWCEAVVWTKMSESQRININCLISADARPTRDTFPGLTEKRPSNTDH